MDDEQGVVDGERQADELHDVGHVEDHEEVMGEDVDHAQRARDGRARDEEGDQRRPADPQDGDEEEQRERQGEDLAPSKVALQYGGDVVLERRRTRHQRVRESRVSQGGTQLPGDVRRTPQVHRGVDVGVEQATHGALFADGAGRYLRRRDVDLALERRDLLGRGVREGYDHCESTFDVLVEVSDEDRVRLRRVGAGHGERGREKLREMGRRERTDDGQCHPDRNDDESSLDDQANPPFQHTPSVLFTNEALGSSTLLEVEAVDGKPALHLSLRKSATPQRGAIRCQVAGRSRASRSMSVGCTDGRPVRTDGGSQRRTGAGHGVRQGVGGRARAAV